VTWLRRQWLTRREVGFSAVAIAATRFPSSVLAQSRAVPIVGILGPDRDPSLDVFLEALSSLEVLMRRREVIGIIGAGAVIWPFRAKAQQAAMPVLGLLSSVPFEARRDQLAGFRRGLKEAGFVEGQNIRIEFRWADNQNQELLALAADLAKVGVSGIVTIGGDRPILAAKAMAGKIPIVFVTGGDPVKNGFVASLNRPGGNLTGVSFLPNLLVAKRVQLLSELTRTTGTMGLLVNPTNPNARSSRSDAHGAARELGRKLVVLEAAVVREIDRAFARFAGDQVEAVVVEADPFFLAKHREIVVLAARHALPAIYAFREFAEAGGLMSYGASLADAYYQAGVYGGRILKGEKPADLPVVQSAKFELVINLATAKALGLEIPPTLLVRADEVIE
jgi:putative tryptophan/tyrosine transport system substrate-binding protein